MFIWFSATSVLELSEKSYKYDLDVDKNNIYKSETGVYSNSDITWTRQNYTEIMH